MTKPRTIRRETKTRTIRAAKLGSARDAIGKLTAGCEIFILTFGQFSLIDALVTILESTGPADVNISTWTAAHAHLERAQSLLQDANIRKLRYVVDRSFLTRQPDYCQRMRELFGDDCIRTQRSHAKFMTISNEHWDIAVRTSMNLNENPRLENLEISDDRELCHFLVSVVDDVFKEHSEGDFAGEIPDLASIPSVPMAGAVTATPIARELNTPTVRKP